MRLAVAAVAVMSLVACAQPESGAAKNAETASAPITPVATEAAAGAYELDPSHASLIFRANHLGFAHYTARFVTWDADLQLDPANPAAAQVTAVIDLRSLDADNPPAGFLDMLLGPDWLAAGANPEMTFRSTRVEMTGPDTARITGNLTFRGTTQPVTLDAKFNGGYAGHPLDPRSRIGFSARGVLNRSAFGMTIGLPEPGTTIGVFDAIEFIIEAEFQGPPYTPPAPAN